jgi:hypothetical protein
MTMGSALHHTSEIICLYKFNEYIICLLVKGVVDSYWNITLEAETNLTRYGPVFRYVTIRRWIIKKEILICFFYLNFFFSRIIQWIFSLIIFSIVFGIAMSNPKVRKTECFNHELYIYIQFRVLKQFLNKLEVFFKILKWDYFLQ